jgi:hypothetical protein
MRGIALKHHAVSLHQLRKMEFVTQVSEWNEARPKDPELPTPVRTGPSALAIHHCHGSPITIPNRVK